MNEALAKIAESLAAMRVDIAEIRRDLAHTIKATDDLKQDMVPVKRRMAMVEGALALLGFLGFGGALKLFKII